jgi:hypothetical protein
MLAVSSPDQSGFAPKNFTTLAHFSVSSAMNLPKAEGARGNASPPMSANRVFNFGSASPALISWLSLAMISLARKSHTVFA